MKRTSLSTLAFLLLVNISANSDIRIISADYGSDIWGRIDISDRVHTECRGKNACTFTMNNRFAGRDPVKGVTKSLKIKARCNNGPIKEEKIGEYDKIMIACKRNDQISIDSNGTGFHWKSEHTLESVIAPVGAAGAILLGANPVGAVLGGAVVGGKILFDVISSETKKK